MIARGLPAEIQAQRVDAYTLHRKNTAFNLSFIIKTGTELSGAVAFSHEHNVLHRDTNAQNRKAAIPCGTIRLRFLVFSVNDKQGQHQPSFNKALETATTSYCTNRIHAFLHHVSQPCTRPSHPRATTLQTIPIQDLSTPQTSLSSTINQFSPRNQ